MLNVAQFAKLVNLHPSRIRALLKEGRIKGAQKIGRDWVIPKNAKILPP
jgi:hypothetical protein